MAKSLEVRTAEVVHLGPEQDPPPRNSEAYFKWVLENRASVIVCPPPIEDQIVLGDDVLFQREQPPGRN